MLDALEQAIGVEDAPRQIEALRFGLGTRDVEQVHRAAHMLKSISATVGAEALSAAARELETLTLPATTAAADLAEPEIAALVDVIATEFGRARDELNALVPAGEA